MNSDHKRGNNRNKGYTLLFAVLTATLVLGVAIYITGVSRKQLVLSSTARESMYAIYAADSGIECIARIATDMSSSSPQPIAACGNSAAISWNDNKSSGRYPIPSGFQPDSSLTPVQSWYSNAISLRNGECAVIIYSTGLNADNSPTTVFDSRGYNYCTGSPLQPDSGQNSRTVERALRLTYGGVW